MNRKLAPALVIVLIAAVTVVAIMPVFASTSDFWTKKTPIPHTLRNFSFSTVSSGPGVGVLNQKIYAVLDNYDFSNPLTAYFSVYNPSDDSWVEKTPLPQYVGPNYVVTTCKGKLYVLSGSPISNEREGSNLVYDPQADTWNTLKPMPGSWFGNNMWYRYNPAGVQANEVGGKIYIVGGIQSGSYQGEYEVSRLNNAYDPANDLWSQFAPIPVGVFGYASVVFGNRIYVIGGIMGIYYAYFGAEGIPLYTNLVQVFDPETNQWSMGTPLPSNMSDLGATTTTGLMSSPRIYVFGGTTSNNQVSDSTWIYDPQTGLWSNGTSLPIPISGASCANVNDRLYVLSGENSSRNWGTTNYEYTPADYGLLGSPSSLPSSIISPTSMPSASVPELATWLILPLILAVMVMTFACLERKGNSKHAFP